MAPASPASLANQHRPANAPGFERAGPKTASPADFRHHASTLDARDDKAPNRGNWLRGGHHANDGFDLASKPRGLVSFFALKNQERNSAVFCPRRFVALFDHRLGFAVALRR